MISGKKASRLYYYFAPYTSTIMKALIVSLSVLIAAVTVSCNGSSATPKAGDNSESHMSDSANYTTSKWADSVQNFGSVVKGKQVQILFHVTNTGNKPLFLASVRPGCGCTVADFTKSAIAPGASGQVAAKFDSNHGRAGTIHKTIDVTSNTSPVHTTLVFDGLVTDSTTH